MAKPKQKTLPKPKTKAKPKAKPKAPPKVQPKPLKKFDKSFFVTVVLLVFVVGGLTLAYWLHSQYSSRKVADEPLNIPTSHPKPYPESAPRPAEPPRDYTIPPIENGLAPVLTTIPTKKHVVFLGIDDGINKQPFELQMMKANHVKATLFLVQDFIKDNPDFFKSFLNEGSRIEDHTVSHPLLSNLSYDEQKQEICDDADWLQQEYGQRPIIFRPPGGDYNEDTQRAAADCGMKAVVLWVAKANGGSMQYQVGNSLRPGDIVLMHFRPEFKSDMQAFLNAQNAAGLHTELLENWLGP